MQDINGINSPGSERKDELSRSGFRLALVRPSDAAETASVVKPNKSFAKRRRKLHFLRFLDIGVKHKKVALFVMAIFTCAALGFGIFRAIPKHATYASTPLPSSLITGLPYSVYYINSVTDGYNLQANSANVKAGILFYTLQAGKKMIFITEQQLPSNINLNSLPQHNSIQVPIGQAILGTGLGNPSVVIMAPQTLVELTSNKGVTKADVVGIAEQLTEAQR